MYSKFFKFISLVFLLTTFALWQNSFAQLSGTKTIPGDYATIQAAVADLNAQGVGAGGVTFNVAAGHTESTSADIVIDTTTTSGNPIVFQKSGGGANPLVTRTDNGVLATSTIGGAGDAIFRLEGTDYITFDGIDVAADSEGVEYGYLTHKPNDIDGCQYVTITNCVITMARGTNPRVIGIYIGNGTVSTSSATGVTVTAATGINSNITITGNTIQNVASCVYVRGSSATGFADSDVVIGQSGAGNTFQNFGINTGSTNTEYGVYFIYQNNPSVSYNTFDNAGAGGAATNGTFYQVFFSSGVSGDIVASNNAMTIENAATSSSTYFIYSTNTVNSETVENNTFASNDTLPSGSLYFIYLSNGTPNKTVNNNSTVGSFIKAGGGTYCYYNGASPTSGLETITNNTFSNIEILSGTSTFYGIYSYTASGHDAVVTGNTLSNISGVGGTFYGLRASSANNCQVSGNTVHDVTAASTIYGLYGGNTTGTYYNNSIYGLTYTGTSTSILYGVYQTGGTDNTYYNNFISDLNSPNGTSTSGAVRAFYLTSGTNVNLYYNTVYLDYVGVGANYSIALYASSSLTSLDMRNNIFINNVDVSAGGTAWAFYASSSAILTTLAATTNNNLYYAGTPSATNLIYRDGTNTAQTLGEYKTIVSPLESASISSLPPFVNVATTPYDLHMSTTTPTQTESGGTPVAGITTDYDGDTRNVTTPDIGADEFNGIGADLTPPSIVYTLLPNDQYTSTSVSLTATITDASGIASGANLPRLYLKKINDVSYVFDNNPTISVDDYTFTIAYSAIGGISIGDTIVYYVAAEDVNGNAGTNPIGGSGSNPPGTVPPPVPNGYIITDLPLSGTYTVGLTEFIQKTGRQVYFETRTRTVTRNINGEDAVLDINDFGDDKNSQTRKPDLNPIYETVTETYEVLMENGQPFDTKFFQENTDGIYPTLTAAVNDLNLRGMSGPVVFSLVDTYYPNETYPILIGEVTGTSSTNTLTIKPATGIQTEIPGDVAQPTSTLQLGFADNVIIDGSNTTGGTTKDLKIVGLNAAPAIHLYGDASNNIVKNLVVESSNTSTGSGAMLFGSGPFDCDNNVFQNCTVKPIDTLGTKNGVGVYFFSSNTGDGNQILDCTIYDWNSYGLRLQGAPTTNTLVSGCDVYQTSQGSTSPYGLYISRVEGLLVEKCKITNMIGTSTVRGVYVSGNSLSGDFTFKNNFISISATTNLTSGTIYGLDYWGYAANSFEAYNNSIYIGGTDVTTGSTYALACRDDATTYKAYNNAVFNARSNSTGTGKHYAIYISDTLQVTRELDYNDFFVNGTGGVFGYYQGILDIADLATWQTTTGLDANSVSGDPHFTGNDDLHIVPQFNTLDGKATYFAFVPDDIDGDTRNATTPDIGADEYTYVPPSVLDPTNVTATAISDTQIDVGFTANGNNNNVVIVFNLTGTFTTPSGPPPSPGDPFAGGTFLASTITSPYNHTALTQTTTYFYKLFSYDGVDYSPGVNASATTMASPLTIPYSQSFDDATFPPAWSQSSSDWTVSNTTNAGGTAYEMNNTWFSFVGATRLIVGPINTTGLTSLALEFKHFFDDYGPGVTIKIQSSADATIWTDEVFSFASGGGNIGPETVNTTIANNVGGTTYIAWVVDGDHFQLDHWYIDDVIITEPLAHDVGTISIDVASVINPGTVTPQATVKNFGTNTETFDVQMTITGGYSSTKTVTSLAPGTSEQVTFDSWSASPGYNVVQACTQLGGDLNIANDCMDKVVSVVDTTGEWTSGTPMAAGTGTYLGTGVGVNAGVVDASGYLYSIGGNTVSTLLTEVWRYNLTTSTWDTLAPLPAGRRVLASAHVGNYIYAIGGSDGSSIYQSTVYQYNIALDTWTTVASLPITHGWGKAVGYMGNYIYLAGGWDGTNYPYLSTIYLYNVSTNTWTTATSMPAGRIGGAFTLTDGNKLVYVGGADYTLGIVDEVMVGTIDALDPTIISWATMATPYPGINKELYSEYDGKLTDLIANDRRTKTHAPEATSYPAGTMFRFDAAPWGSDGMIVTTGSPASAWTPANPNPCYVYKPATDSWIAQENLPIPVLATSLGSVNEGDTWSLVVATGYTGSVVSTATQIYTQTLGGAATFPFTLNVTNGWNMVSVPGTNPAGMGVNTWWTGKDPAADVFKYSGGYVAVTTAAPSEGYWMKNVGAQVYNYTDIQIVNHAPIAGATGWNLFGGYELTVGTAGITTNPAGLQDGPVYEYSGGYQVATALAPGYGYWIKLTGAGQIILPEVLAKGTEPIEYFPEEWGKVVLTDATGINYTLYAVNGEVDLNQYELPPAPPQGMFDIRFSSGRIAEEMNSSVKEIELTGVTYPLTIKVENMDIRIMDESRKKINENLKDGEEIVVNDAQINKLMVSGELLPTVYALEQNYPNPFNPSTTIEFSLPEDVKNVRLSIYNVLGEKVTELVNTSLIAGKYQYKWNAGNVATGMYIYELRTDKFVSVKKMMLLK